MVRQTLHETGTLYAVDEKLLRSLAPDLILTQELCQVCAPSGNDITKFLASLERPPEVLYFSPHTLDEVDDKANPMGIKGVGELGISGAGAAVANAIYNACGVRVRDYPITPDKLLAALMAAGK